MTASRALRPANPDRSRDPSARASAAEARPPSAREEAAVAAGSGRRRPACRTCRPTLDRSSALVHWRRGRPCRHALRRVPCRRYQRCGLRRQRNSWQWHPCRILRRPRASAAGPGVHVHAFEIGGLRTRDVRARHREPDGHVIARPCRDDFGRRTGQLQQRRQRRTLLAARRESGGSHETESLPHSGADWLRQSHRSARVGHRM